MNPIVKLISAGALLISGCTNCTTASADTFKVDLDLKGVSDTVSVRLRPVTHKRNTEPLAEGKFVNGKATLTGEVNGPTPVYLSLSNAAGSFPMVVELGTVTVSGDISGKPSEWDATRIDYNFDNAVISGSENYPIFKEIIDTRERLSEDLYAMRAEHAAVQAQLSEAYKADDKARMEEIKKSAAWVAYEEAEASHAKKIDQEYGKAILKNKDNFWGPASMLYLYVYFIPEMRTLYEQFGEEAKASKYGLEVKKELYPVGRPGEHLNNFTASTSDGNPVTMLDVAKNSKLTLIDFWASWCRPCRAEIPNLKKAYELYHDKGFDILSVSIDDEDAAWRKALDKEQMPWTNCRDTEKDIRETYGVQSIPMLVAVDKDGNMVFENIRGEELISKIGELLGVAE